MKEVTSEWGKARKSSSSSRSTRADLTHLSHSFLELCQQKPCRDFGWIGAKETQKGGGGGRKKGSARRLSVLRICQSSDSLNQICVHHRPLLLTSAHIVPIQPRNTWIKTRVDPFNGWLKQLNAWSDSCRPAEERSKNERGCWRKRRSCQKQELSSSWFSLGVAVLNVRHTVCNFLNDQSRC